MKKFQFTLQKLLDIRAFREKEAETNLGRAVAAREAIVLRLTEIGQEEAKTRRSLWNSLKTAEELNLHENYLTRPHNDRKKQETALLEAELAVEKMRKLYIKAHQERLIVSKLRERKESEWKADMLKQQDAVLDDIVNAREYRKSQNLYS